MNVGDRVGHAKWGLGQILELLPNGAARIYFEEAGEKKLLLAKVGLELVVGDEARSIALDHIKISKTGEVVRGASIDDLIAKFKALFPGGFDGADYIAQERDYKIEAHEMAKSLLDEGSLRSAIERDAYEEVCRDAMRVMDKTNIVFPQEKMQIKDGLKSGDGARRFAQSLVSVLYGEEPLEERFTSWVETLAEIGSTKWTVATYYLFIRHPEEHFFLKPTVTKDAADVCGFEINYRPEPNWLTYRSALTLAKQIREQIADLGPRDMIDVQSFLWCVAQR